MPQDNFANVVTPTQLTPTPPTNSSKTKEGSAVAGGFSTSQSPSTTKGSSSTTTRSIGPASAAQGAPSKTKSSGLQNDEKPMFFREQGYGLTASRGTPSHFGFKDRTIRRNGRDILGEALREQGKHAHVPNASPPKILFGMDGNHLLRWWTEHIKRTEGVKVPTKTLGHRQQRSDTPTMISAVATYPQRVNGDDAGFKNFAEHALTWAKKHYGNLLLSVIMHDDESYPHLHIIAAGSGESMKTVLAGHAASITAAREGATKKDQSLAYKSGCQRIQDEFWAATGAPCGLTRLSAHPAPRKTRASALISKEKLLDAREAEVRATVAAVESKILSLLSTQEEVNRRNAAAKLRIDAADASDESFRLMAIKISQLEAELADVLAREQEAMARLRALTGAGLR